MNDMPWTESATLVRLAQGSDDTGTEILFEGTLEQMTRRVTIVPRSKRTGMRISLPDRKVRPHTFEGAALDALVDKLASLGV